MPRMQRTVILKVVIFQQSDLMWYSVVVQRKLPMKFKVKLLIIAVAIVLPLSAEDIQSSPLPSPLRLSCEDHVTVQSSIIAALRAENETLSLRVAALSQLLAANQRREVDQKAQAAILETQRKVLSGMGLSVTDCNVSLDGLVDCKESKKVKK